MRNMIIALACAAILLFAPPQSTQIASAESGKMRTFLYIGEPNAAAWKFMIEKPVDRRKAASQVIESSAARC